MSELLQILTVGQELLHGDRTTAYLMAHLVVSRPTLMRHIAELRHMGCAIVSVREGGRSVFRLENPAEVCGRLVSRIRLEKDRSLREILG